MSQNIDIGLRFCFMVCKRRDFEENHKKITKVTRFWLYKNKRAYIITVRKIGYKLALTAIQIIVPCILYRWIEEHSGFKLSYYLSVYLI